ncbi:MAG: DNA polymerase IV [Anaerolineae bacterium]|nr:DNA polymerase IV [Anaerolineae bacterium]
MVRKILHLDLDAFFCAVEELGRPDLVGKPFAVGGRPEARGVVSSCSYPARRKGVRSAMPMARALRLCPELIVVSGHHSDYRAYSQRVMAVLGEYTALIEQISIDEAFLDLTDLPQSGEELAHALQRAIREQVHLPCSLGVATNKLVAKSATEYGKSQHRGEGYPNAVTVVPPGQETAFLAPLPVQALWGVGPKTAEALEGLRVKTIGDLAALPEAVLARKFGINGHDLWLRARGVDDHPVETEHAIKSVSQETTFERDVSDGERLRRVLRELSENVAFRLRADRLCASTVKLKLRWADFTTPTRQVSLAMPTDQDGVIYAAALGLFDALWEKGRPVRLLGVGAGRLSEAAHQPSLWDTPDDRERRLLDALDDLRERFGERAVRRGKRS